MLNTITNIAMIVAGAAYSVMSFQESLYGSFVFFVVLTLLVVIAWVDQYCSRY